MAAAVELMLHHFPVAAMKRGDVYITNDPWIGSGHLNDLLLVAPVFCDADAAPVALTACTSHVYDLGGLGMGPDGSDIYDEGLFIPPALLVDRPWLYSRWRSSFFLILPDAVRGSSSTPTTRSGVFCFATPSPAKWRINSGISGGSQPGAGTTNAQTRSP